MKLSNKEALYAATELVEQSYACDLKAQALQEAVDLGRPCVVYIYDHDYEIRDLTDATGFEYNPSTDILVNYWKKIFGQGRLILPWFESLLCLG